MIKDDALKGKWNVEVSSLGLFMAVGEPVICTNIYYSLH